MKTVCLHDIKETSPRFTTNKNDNIFIFISKSWTAFRKNA